MSAKSDRTPALGEFEMFDIVWNSYTTPELINRCSKFEFRSNDICVCTFPRCGTTVTQEIVWHIINRETICKGEKYAPIDDRFPFLEFDYNWASKIKQQQQSPKQQAIDLLEQTAMDEQRLIKTHCPLSVIGPGLDAAKPRVICVVRNPKDCCHSLFRFYKGHEMYGPWPGDWEEFVQIFLNGQTMCGDYFQVSADWWKQGSKENVLMVQYEQIVHSPALIIKRIAEFLDCPLTEEQLDCIVHNCSFDTMCINENVNKEFATGFRFLRKGKVGDWKTKFTIDQSEAFDMVVKDRLESVGMTFDYE